MGEELVSTRRPRQQKGHPREPAGVRYTAQAEGRGKAVRGQFGGVGVSLWQAQEAGEGPKQRWPDGVGASAGGDDGDHERRGLMPSAGSDAGKEGEELGEKQAGRDHAMAASPVFP